MCRALVLAQDTPAAVDVAVTLDITAWGLPAGTICAFCTADPNPLKVAPIVLRLTVGGGLQPALFFAVPVSIAGAGSYGEVQYMLSVPSGSPQQLSFTSPGNRREGTSAPPHTLSPAAGRRFARPSDTSESRVPPPARSTLVLTAPVGPQRVASVVCTDDSVIAAGSNSKFIYGYSNTLEVATSNTADHSSTRWVALFIHPVAAITLHHLLAETFFPCTAPGFCFHPAGLRSSSSRFPATPTPDSSPPRSSS